MNESQKAHFFSGLMMKRNFAPVFMVVICCVMLFSSCATIAQVSTRIEESGGVAYYMHTVEKKQTLYSISKLYKCDINDIAEANPGSDAGIQEGQVIKIPVNKSRVKGSTIETSGDKSFILHEVKRKETLFSIARQYDVDVNDIIAANPGADNGIRKGQEIRIPVKSKVPVALPAVVKHMVVQGETLYGIANRYGVTVESIQAANGGLKEGLKAGVEILIPSGAGVTIATDGTGVLPDKRFGKEILVVPPVYKPTYKIALMLPFYTNYKDTMEVRDKKLREVALQLYRGAMLAADTLQKRGLNAEIFVYDVIDEKGEVARVLAQPEMKDMDLVIGPAFKNPMNEMARWGAENGVHVVCPVQLPNNVLLSSPNMSKALPSGATLWVGMAKFIYEKHKNDNIIIIDSKNIDDRRLVDAFREEWKALSGDSLRNVVVVADASTFTVKDKYAAGKKNVVVVPTSDKKVIGTLFKSLGEGDIIVYGAETWDNMESISVANRNRYHVHFPQTTFIDYKNPQVQSWIEAYRRKFKSEPGNFAVSGYDITMFYGMGLKDFGRAFPNHFDEILVKPVGSGFDYFKTSDEGGFENKFVMVIGTNSYELQREQ